MREKNLNLNILPRGYEQVREHYSFVKTAKQ